MKDTPEIYFHVSSSLNLYYSLEVATGSIKEGYNEEYAELMKNVFPEDIARARTDVLMEDKVLFIR